MQPDKAISFRISRQPLATFAWLLIATACGVIVAVLPLGVALGIFGLAALFIVAIITPLAALIALLILAPLRTLIATESTFQLPLDIGQLTLGAMLLAWVIYRTARGERLLRPVWSPVYLPVLLFTVAAGLTAFSATSLGSWLNEWLKWLQMLVLIALALTFGGGRRWEWLLFGLVLSGVANGIIGVYEFFGGSGADHLLLPSGNYRAFGTFGQPNPFGGFMGLIAPLALMAALGYTIRLWQTWRSRRIVSLESITAPLFYTAASLIIVVGVGISWSRGAWLGFAVSILALAFALPRKAWQSAALLLIVVGGSLLLWSTGRLPATITERVNSATEELFAFDDVRAVEITPENYAVVERLAHWQAALRMAAANPFLGVGMGNYEVVYPDYRLINWPFPLGHAHNYYLNVLAEAGMIGLLAYSFMWGGVIWITWRTRRHPDLLARLTAVGLLGTWTYLSIHSLTDNLYVNNLFLHLGVMLGLLAVLHRQTWKGAPVRLS